MMVQFILGLIGPVLARIFMQLGVGLVAYVGLTELGERLVGQAVSGLQSMPSIVVQWAALLGVDRAISLVLSAYLARLAIAATRNVGFKRSQ